MPRLSSCHRAFARGAGRDGAVAKGNCPGTSAGVAAAPDLMARGGQLAIPSLDGVPLQHRFSAGDRASIALARTLLELDLAAPEDWEVANRDPGAYVLVTLDRRIAAHGGSSIKRRFDLYVTLYLTIDQSRSGFVILNPTLKLLEEANPRLPATFYGLFAGALNRWVRLYDYQEAQERVTMWREWMEGEADAEQYEIPDVEGCIPGCLRQRPLSRQRLQEVRAQVEGREAQSLLKAVVELSAISQGATRPELTDEMREELCDTNPPLPSLLAVFLEGDAIEACFDDEGQTALEVTPEPSVIIPLNAHQPESVRQAFDTLGVVCETLAAASRAIDRMPGNEGWVIEH